MTIQNKNYIAIQGWMRTELNLSGNDLIVYALIYGFCQSENQKFNGSLQYIADWCGATKQGVMKNLQNLISRNLIVKEPKCINGVNIVEYYTTEFNTPIQQSCTNNIEHTIGKKDILNNKLFNTPEIESKKPKKKNLYSKCYDYIMQYTNNVVLQDALCRFLDLRLEIAKQECKPFYYNMWPSIVTELDTLAGSTEEAVKIVNKSIESGWKRFYPLKDYNKSATKSHITEKNVDTIKRSDDELDLADEVY